jgi:hypothetical protein
VASRRHERIMEGEAVNTLALESDPVPIGEKWVMRNVTLTNVDTSNDANTTLAIDRGGGLVIPIWTGVVAQGVSVQPILLCTLYGDDKLKLSVAGVFDAVWGVVSAVVYSPA